MGYLGRTKPSETTSSVLRSTYTGNGSTTTYALPGPVANETSIIATINGVTQQDAAYSTDGSNIIFVAAPALGDSIEIRTLSAVAMSYAPSAGSVVTGTIADLAVTTAKINDLAVTTAKINDLAVTGGKIAAATITQDKLASNVAGTGPAFSAYSSANQNPSSGTQTKVIFGTKSYDTNSNYDPTLSRFTPTVAGYYQLITSVSMAADTTITGARLYFTKNGSGLQVPSMENTNTGGFGGGYYTVHLSALVLANGTTDYFEVYGMCDGTGSLRYFFNSNPGIHATVFQGFLVRAA